MTGHFFAVVAQFLLIVFFLGSAGFVLFTYRESQSMVRRLPSACRLKNLEEKIASKEALLQELTDNTNHLYALREETKELEVRRERLEKSLADKEDYEQQLHLLQSQHQQKLAELEGLQEESEACKDDVARARELIQQKQEVEEELTTLMQQEEEVRQSIADLNMDMETIDKNHFEKTTELQGLLTEVASVREENDLITAEVMEKQSTVEKLENETNKLETELERLTYKHQWLTKLESERAEEAEENRKLQHELLMAMTETQRVIATQQEEKPVDPAIALQDFSRPAITKKWVSGKGSEQSEADCLATVAGELKERGFTYSERLLNAFHTSLKINDVTPLVILSGISGTGKSALPQHYAELMGINFLNVAVQPRWDSPDDLFGFYNYLEKRYRANDLSRALLQMDGYNWPAWQKVLALTAADHRSDELLLVLLDEMNLARVEHYFSEFLSKLEMRQRVNASDCGEREKASISLNIPMLAEETSLKLFVANNVLFVGTMNEDESTLALSDKVLDRSNVIRFGKPKDLAITSKKSIGQIHEGGLARATWEGWHHSIDGMAVSERERIQSWLGKINNALEPTGRSFAHRLSNSVLAYVANYPKQDASSLDLAFADQLEFRILPKCRGLEREQLSDLRNKLTPILAEIKDEALNEALEDAWKLPVFEWRGVARA